MNAKKEYSLFSLDTKGARSLLPVRPERSNKGDFGRVLCVCGSHGMAGAAYLCAKSAYRSGAGIVEIFTQESNRVILQTLVPEAVITVYEEYSPDLLLAALSRANSVVAGCGMGITPTSRKILSDLLHTIEPSRASLILDADALNLLSRNPSLLKYAKDAVITPHAMEMSRLTGKCIDEILALAPDVAYEYAKTHSLICVLKDRHTVVTDGSGRLFLNKSGNNALSTGGSGDVLSGILGGLFAQRHLSSASALELTALGVYLHGLCGDIAAEELSEYSVMANDIIGALPSAFKNIIKN